MTVTNLNDVGNTDVKRFATGFDDLDWIYGESIITINGQEYTVKGLPYGGLSLWGGEAGVGKTRVCTQVCKFVASQHGMLSIEKTPINRKVLYFQLETTLQQYKAKIGTLPRNGTFAVSDDKNLDDQIRIVKAEQPRLIVVDSVNKIREYRNGYGTDEIEEKYRQAIETMGAHVIFITHLNDEGGVKGGTNLPHMVDSVVFLTKEKTPFDTKAYIKLKMSDTKHRFGIGGKWMWLQHTDEGVIESTSNHLTDGDAAYIKGLGKVSDILAQKEYEQVLLQAQLEKQGKEQANALNLQVNREEVQENHRTAVAGGNWLQQILGIEPPIK